MTTMIRSRMLWTSLVAAGIGWLTLAHAVAGPVVESTDPQATQSTQMEQSSTPADQSTATQDEDQQKKKKTTQTKPAPSEAAAAPSTSGQPTTTFSPNPLAMPVPPTYAPGAPGGPAQTANPYGMMPSPPTAYGPYGAPNSATTSSSAGAAGTAWGWSGAPTSTGAPLGYAMPSAGGAAGYGGGLGYGVPPSPTQPMSLGGAAMADPSFGRYESANIRQATDVRPPATVGESQQRVLQGGKPFSGWRPSDAVSPYQRLNDFDMAHSPGVNQYYSYVKPLLDQQAQNRVVNRDMQGLADTARAGYDATQSTGQRPGNAVPTAAPRVPATFMNTGQFFPDPYAR
jgi:hypothetical protein